MCNVCLSHLRAYVHMSSRPPIPHAMLRKICSKSALFGSLLSYMTRACFLSTLGWGWGCGTCSVKFFFQGVAGSGKPIRVGMSRKSAASLASLRSARSAAYIVVGSSSSSSSSSSVRLSFCVCGVLLQHALRGTFEVTHHRSQPPRSPRFARLAR